MFFGAPGTLKKGGPGGPSKLDQIFGRFGGLPGGPQEGSRLDGSSTFTFAAGPKKGSKMERFGLPNQNYTHFGPPFVRNRGPKSCIVMQCDLRCHSGAKMTDFGGNMSGVVDEV